MHEVVSFFSSNRSKKPKSVKLEYVLSAFKEGVYAEAISKVRAVLEQEGESKCKHPIKDDYPGCWGVATFASNTKSHDDKGRGRPGDCLLRREQDQLQTAPV